MKSAFFDWVRSFFEVPQFFAGDRVNHIPRGVMGKTDGYVVAQGARGVLIEWPRGQVSTVCAYELCLIRTN